MTPITLLVTLVLIGFICWLLLQVPMPAVIQRIIIGVVCLFVIIWLLQSFGLMGPLATMRIK